MFNLKGLNYTDINLNKLCNIFASCTDFFLSFKELKNEKNKYSKLS